MPRKHAAIYMWIQAEKPTFRCLLETKVRQENVSKCLQSTMPGWNIITKYEYHHLGRIWFCWNDDVTVTLLHKTAQIITCVVQIPATGEQFICSAVYAFNLVEERRSLWREIRDTQAAYAHLGMPWILLGDLNTTLSFAEHSPSLHYLPNQTGMRHFQDLVSDCNLSDLSYVGAIFTWWNKRTEDLVGKKLDRALINSNWLRVFPNSYASFDVGGVSDHAQCQIRLAHGKNSARKPFKMFNFLLDHEDFLPVVERFWNQTEPIHHSRSALHLFHKKLKRLKPELGALNRNNYSDFPNRTKNAFEALCSCQNAVLSDPSPTNLEAEALASDHWNKLAAIEEKFYRQKSCIRQLEAGDQNRAFFHRMTQTRTSRNTIRTLTTNRGETLTSLHDIKREAVHHFQRFLQSYGEGTVDISVEELQNILTYRCAGTSRENLVATVTGNEVLAALRSLPADKVFGPDGYTKEFYVAAWAVIGHDFIVVVQSFFIFGFLPSGVNATSLTLIPKTENAQSMKDYRPIACCILLYKVISKILAQRLKAILLEAIEPNQFAFIKGRLLFENVFLAAELVNGYHKSSLSPRSTIKFI